MESDNPIRKGRNNRRYICIISAGNSGIDLFDKKNQNNPILKYGGTFHALKCLIAPVGGYYPQVNRLSQTMREKVNFPSFYVINT